MPRAYHWDTDPWGGGWGYDFGTGFTGVAYRLVLAERSSSGLGAEIIPDVLATGVPFGAESVIRWSRQLNGAGTLEFTLPTDGDNVTPEIYAPGQRELHLYRDDGGGELLVWAGRLWIADVEKIWVRFMGIGWYEILRHREVGEDFYKVQTEQLNIAWELIDYTQGLPNGDEGIVQASSTASGISRTTLYCAEERQNIAAAIEDLAGADNGFDFDITPNKSWRVWHPAKGTDLSETVKLDGRTTISELSYTVDATQVANEIAGVGKAEDCEPIHYDVESDESSRSDYGLMQASLSRPDIRQDEPLISALAREQLRLQKHAHRAPTVSYPLELGGPTPLTGDFELGDIIGVKATRGYATFDEPFRVLSYTVTANQIGREHIELTLDPADAPAGFIDAAVEAPAAGFVPSDLSDLMVWLKADGIEVEGVGWGLDGWGELGWGSPPSPTDGDAVETWTDSSGNGNSPTQATVANRPIYKTNAVNSTYPVVRFGGVSDDDSMQAIFDAALPQPNTVYVAVKCNVNKVQVIVDGGGAGGRHLFGDELSSTKFSFFAGSAVVEGASRDTSWHIWAGVFNGASSTLYLDGGAAFAAGNPGSNTMSGITLGDNYLQPHANGLDADIFEVLVYAGAHSTTEIDQVGVYLANRIGTAWDPAT